MWFCNVKWILLGSGEHCQAIHTVSHSQVLGRSIDLHIYAMELHRYNMLDI